MVEDIDYHKVRARQELDLGLRAESLPAARAHLGLAAIHMEKVRVLAVAPETRPLLSMYPAFSAPQCRYCELPRRDGGRNA
jgi:hypothetical protein